MINEQVRLRSLDIPAKFSHNIGNAEREKRIPLHYHNEIELIRVRSGKFPCTVNGEELVLTERETLFINSRISHSTLTGRSCHDMIQINLERLLFSENPDVFVAPFMFFKSNVPYYIFRGKEAEKLLGICDGIFEEYGSEQIGSESFLLGGLHSLCGVLIRHGLVANPHDMIKSRQLIKLYPAIKHITENYALDISTPQLATLCSLNTAYFCEIFKSATGKTPINFINAVRVYHAERLINSTDKNMTEIATEVGFSSSAYFDRVFKKINGSSPTYYRKLKFDKM